LELVVSCLNAGLWREADLLLDRMPVKSPMVHYYRGWLTELTGQKETALAHYKRGAEMPLDDVFPFQIEAMEALKAAIAANPQDAHAPYYLGLLLYDRQPEEAMKLWTRALAVDPQLAIAQRNLAVAYARQDDGVPKAVSALEKAISLNGNDALYLFELDRLYEFAQTPVEKRLALFEGHMATAAKRDDAMSRVVTLEILGGKYDQAIEIMRTRHFHLWEGGARFNVQDSWTDALLLRGHKKMAAKDYAGALADYTASIQYPENIEVTRAYRGSRAPEAFYYAGLAQEALGKKAEAQKLWRDSAAELIGSEDNPRVSVDSAALLFYQAMSLSKLGETARAAKVFALLRTTAERALQGRTATEFFAKFGEQRSPRMRAAQAHYVSGLAELGMGQSAKAKAAFQKALELNTYLLDARTRVAGVKQ
jgi:tetratricopeptide (TPR) repeat protein